MKQHMIVILGSVLMWVGCGGGQAPVEAQTEEPATADQPAAEAEPAESPADGSEAVAEPAEPTEPGASKPEPAEQTEAKAAEKATENPNEAKEAIEARITDRNIVISGKVLFETGKAKLKKVSFKVLDEVVRAMEKHPEIVLMQVVGHTDGDGNAKANKKLSKRRATAVMKYLIRKGIQKKRLSSAGLGEDAPIASNDTEEGKEKNRRVEFVIVERSQVKAVTHTSSTASPVRTTSRSATNDEVEELIKKEGLEEKLH